MEIVDKHNSRKRTRTIGNDLLEGKIDFELRPRNDAGRYFQATPLILLRMLRNALSVGSLPVVRRSTVLNERRRHVVKT
ncbi:hypothetical protein TNCV_2721261 [Trichonephila clavipes]|nr:hypothetical protein TNCV_2721261 [Trichonephila clavipes]